MASATFDGEGGWRRWGRYAVPTALLLLAAWLVWSFAHQETGVRREAPAISTLIPVDEPPPPPPPKTPPPPQPRPDEVPTPQPTPQAPTPTPQSPSPAQPTVGQNAVTENGPPQAGSDAFNIGAGDGSGGRGAGSGGGFETAGLYGQYVRAAMTREVRASPLLKDKALRAEVLVWFDAQGRVTRAEIAKGSGAGAYDAEIRRVLLALGGLRPPAVGALAQMPIRFTIDERRPL
jgi:TonB family protein